ncbi:MAG: tripartite tricarboxylate transporter substrate binding protein [Pseudomonadota bacterium]
MKRAFLKHIALLAVGMLVAPFAAAQANYPDRPIRLIVAFPPGGVVDPAARVVAQKMSELLGQPIVIDNRAGGNTSIGAGMVAKAPADGYTLLFTAGSTHVIHTLQSTLPYDSLRDFAPVAPVSRSGYMMAVHSSVPAKTLPEFIAYAKANPGKLNYASSGVGNANHLSVELFNIRTGVKITHVPYKGGAPALLDLAAGRVQVMITTTSLLQPHVQSGTLRALAYSSQVPGQPPVPLFSQFGLEDLEKIESVNVILAPVATPAPIIAKLSAAVKKALEAPEVRTGIENLKMEPFFLTPAELGERMRGERARYVEVIEKANIQLTP